GDAEFQKKSLGKMEEVTKQGRTVLFVSHNMAAVQNLCSKGVLIDNGKVKYINDTKEVISRYISYNNNLQSKVTDLSLIKRGHYKQDLIFDKIIFDKIVFPFNETITFYIELKSLCDKRNFNNLDFGVAISNNYEQTLIHISNRFINKVFNHDNDNDLYKFEIENNIKPGNYNLTLFLRANNEIQDWLKNVITIKIEDGNPYEYSNSREIQGVIFEKFNINKVEK
ncbi:MAG: Wzt carbohydrate-binding domain-containing protein, partial [Bacteroidales bacterium]|nr:Wzt carbohydrate-binding domain-containing protein [Bacteroidales bacterium]